MAAALVIMLITRKGNASWTATEVWIFTKKMTPCSVSTSVRLDSTVSKKTPAPNTVRSTALSDSLRTNPPGLVFRLVPPPLHTTLISALASVLIHAEKSLICLRTISTELVSCNALPMNLPTITLEGACWNVCSSRTLTSLWMELREFVCFSVQSIILPTTAPEGAELDVPPVPTTLLIGNPELVSACAPNPTPQSFMPTIKRELVFQLAPEIPPTRIGLRTEIQLSEFACQLALECSTQIHQLVTV